MLPVVAEAFSHEAERKLKCIGAGKTPCGVGTANGHKVKVMRDTGSTTCIVKQSSLDAKQITGNYELCMLIDGVVKRFPTAIVKIQHSVLQRHSKGIMHGEPSEVIGNRHEVECETQQKQVPVENGENEKMSEIVSMVSNTDSS